VRRLGFLLPVVFFVVVAVGLGIGLTRNPQEIPSALVGKPVPEFSLPPVQGRMLGLSSADLQGEVSLVNVFASWCTACRYEHPLSRYDIADYLALSAETVSLVLTDLRHSGAIKLVGTHRVRIVDRGALEQACAAGVSG
jgi:thiol-disulfide isomerase/thioredoxin